MKLLIQETCVVKGGKIKERGEIHDTGDVERKDDREAYELIASGRAITANDKDAPAVAAQIAKEKDAKADAKAAAAKK